MRILQVTPYFAPAWAYGGPPRVVYELSRELVRKGHSVTVLTTDAHDATGRERPLRETVDGIEVRRLRNLSNFLAWNQQLFLPTGAGAFARRHLRDFDIVHLHMFRTLLNAGVHRFALIYGVPFVMSAHGSLPRIVRVKIAKALFDTVVGTRLLRDARKLIALSSAEKGQYESVGVPSSKISVVLNGIDSTAYQQLPPPGAFASAYGLEGKKLITYIGRQNARKGLDHLLRAFREISVAREDVVLVMAGPDDGYRGRLERLAEQLSLGGSVIFTGLVPVSDKFQVLVDSDVVVYPASHEIFGLVPFEALLCNKPVVVTDDSGCGELIRGACAGFIVPFGDEPLLRDAIAVALEKGPAVREMVQRGRRLVLEQLNWKRVGADMESAYRDAISASHEVSLIDS